MLLTVQLPATEGSARSARGAVRQRFRDRIPAIALDDLLAVVSELVTNATRHGSGDSIRLEVELDRDGRVTGEVENQGEGPVRQVPIVPGHHHHLGLHIVNALAERWRVEHNGLTRVVFELRVI